MDIGEWLWSLEDFAYMVQLLILRMIKKKKNQPQMYCFILHKYNKFLLFIKTKRVFPWKLISKNKDTEWAKNVISNTFSSYCGYRSLRVKQNSVSSQHFNFTSTWQFYRVNCVHCSSPRLSNVTVFPVKIKAWWRRQLL